MCDGVGVGWREFQGADGYFPNLATFIFVFCVSISKRPSNLVDMIMALNGGLWIPPPTTQMNCRVHIYSNKCVQPRRHLYRWPP